MGIQRIYEPWNRTRQYHKKYKYHVWYFLLKDIQVSSIISISGQSLSLSLCLHPTPSTLLFKLQLLYLHFLCMLQWTLFRMKPQLHWRTLFRVKPQCTGGPYLGRGHNCTDEPCVGLSHSCNDEPYLRSNHNCTEEHVFANQIFQPYSHTPSGGLPGNRTGMLNCRLIEILPDHHIRLSVFVCHFSWRTMSRNLLLIFIFLYVIFSRPRL